MRIQRFFTLASFASMLVLTGCVTEQVQAPRTLGSAAPRPSPTPSGATPRSPVGPVSPELSVRGEASAARLHDVAGALLMYYAVYKQLPSTLEELKPFADMDAPLEFTSPATGKPLVYTPQGLRLPPPKDDRPPTLRREQKVIILHEADPIKGQRWCILMPDRPIGPTSQPEVLPVPEPFFLTYMADEVITPTPVPAQIPAAPAP